MKKYILLAISFLCFGLMANAQSAKEIFTPEVMKQMNSVLPQQIEEGIILKNMFFEDAYLGMTIGIDESVATMSEVRNEFGAVSGVDLAQLMFNGDPTVPQMLVMLKIGIKMVFVSQQTGEKYTRAISVEEFRSSYN